MIKTSISLLMCPLCSSVQKLSERDKTVSSKNITEFGIGKFIHSFLSADATLGIIFTRFYLHSSGYNSNISIKIPDIFI